MDASRPPPRSADDPPAASSGESSAGDFPPRAILPSLDMLRAFAIVSVVTFHAVLAFGAPESLAPLLIGVTGVDLFFVLSGWLIGRQLMLELQQTGTIRLTRFWSRRWMRTLPAYYAVLVAIFLREAWLGRDLFAWPYLIFGQNYVPALTPFYVSWSLCVEEHFYLLVAPVIVLLGRLGPGRGPAIALFLGLPIVLRTLGLYSSGHETHVTFDACALGVALAALSVYRPRLWAALSRRAAPLALLGAGLYAIDVWARFNPQSGLGSYDNAVCALMFASFVLFTTAGPWRGEAWYAPAARYLATRSYAVYLLHAETLAVLRSWPTDSFVLFSALTWIVTLGAAELLYRLIERPAMRARERLPFSKSGQTAAFAHAIGRPQGHLA